jgi:hypothetical protein
MDETCDQIVKRQHRALDAVEERCGLPAKFVVERQFSGLSSTVCGRHVPARTLTVLGVRVRSPDEPRRR